MASQRRSRNFLVLGLSVTAVVFCVFISVYGLQNIKSPIAVNGAISPLHSLAAGSNDLLEELNGTVAGSTVVVGLHGDVLEDDGSHGLNKRFGEPDFRRMVVAGGQLRCLMFADVQGATNLMGRPSQSTFTDMGAFAANGYMIEHLVGPPAVADLQAFKFDAVSRALGFSYASPPMEGATAKHELPWNNGGVMTPPTHGYIKNFYNIQENVLIISNIISARTAASFNPAGWPAPPLTYFSDIAFLIWADLKGFPISAPPVRITPPRYVIVDTVVNEKTLEALAYIVTENNLGRAGGVTQDWPGVSFTPDQDGFYALLATPNVYGTAWFLITHKDQFGLHTISKITVWVTNPANPATFPMILLEISPVPQPARV